MKIVCPAEFKEYVQKVSGGVYDLPPEYSVTPKTILDVGAEIGAFSARSKTTWPKVKITAFEPSLDNFQYLIKNLSRYEDIHLTHKLGPEDSCSLLRVRLSGYDIFLKNYITTHIPPIIILEVEVPSITEFLLSNYVLVGNTDGVIKFIKKSSIKEIGRA